MSRIVEVFAGAYASGKSEISINRALMLSKQDGPVTLVDLDTVEPAYTLRPIKGDVEKLGIKVITQESYFGLGETGNTITPAQMNCFLYPGDIVIDVGYGAGGLDILDVVNGIEDEENLNIYIVINASKHETSTVSHIVEYVRWSQGSADKNWKRFNGIISNTHFGDETTKQDVLNGFKITLQASEKLNIPVFAVAVSEELSPLITTEEVNGIQIWPIKRYMPKALW
jgi:hypothetical protein